MLRWWVKNKRCRCDEGLVGESDASRDPVEDVVCVVVKDP